MSIAQESLQAYSDPIKEYSFNGEFNISAYNAAQIHRMQTAYRESPHQLGLILDLDETVIDTVELHVALLNGHAQGKGIDTSEMTLDHVISQGGSQHAYRRIFAHMSDEQFEGLMEQVRAASFINRGAPILHPNLPEQLRVSTEGKAEVLGSVTARIGKTRVVRSSYQDLFKRVGLPQFPIVFRPEYVPVQNTAEWKIENILAVAASDPNKIPVLDDDSLSTAKKVAEYNRNRASGDIPIVQILHEGCFTLPQIKKMSDTDKVELKKQGIYIGNWYTLPDTISEIHEQWVQNRP